MLKINTLSRKELYDHVWSKPISTLSKEFDLSELELRRKYNKRSTYVELIQYVFY